MTPVFEVGSDPFRTDPSLLGMIMAWGSCSKEPPI